MAFASRIINGADTGNQPLVMRKIWEALHDVAAVDTTYLDVKLSNDAIGTGTVDDPKFDEGDETTRVIKVKLGARQSGHNDYWMSLRMIKPGSDPNNLFLYPDMRLGTGPGTAGGTDLDDEAVVIWASEYDDTSWDDPRSFDQIIVAVNDRGFFLFAKYGSAVWLFSVDRGRFFSGNEADKLVTIYSNDSILSNSTGTYNAMHDPDDSDSMGIDNMETWSRSFNISGLSSRARPLGFASFRPDESSPYQYVDELSSTPTFDDGTKKLVAGPYPAPDEVYSPSTLWFLSPDSVDGVLNVYLTPTETAKFNFTPLVGTLRIAVRTE